MREIIFRGKRLDNGEWVQGDLFSLFERPCIKFGGTDKEIVWVRSETVGQFIGLTDKKGIMIFEGDILQIWNENPYNHQLHKDCLAKVVFQNGLFGYQEIDDKYKFVYQIESHGFDFNPNRDDIKLFEIIGNIYDNPELLKEGNND